MHFNNEQAELYVPDGSPVEAALQRTTHLGIGAHPDDLEILAWHGISACHNDPERWFSGIVLTNGAGSPRRGEYQHYTDDDMIALRIAEQRSCAEIGRYSAVCQLGYESGRVKDGETAAVRDDVLALLQACQPQVVYLHNLADAHATHVAAARISLDALRELPSAQRPGAIYGVEVWRSLDWLPAAYRTLLPLPANDDLQARLIATHRSQVQGGKAYPRAVHGRQQANATFAQSHAVDNCDAAVIAMDLTPLVTDPALAPAEYIERCLQDFSASLLQPLA